MGDGNSILGTARRNAMRRPREMTVIYTVMVAILILILIQYLLLMVALEEYMSGDSAVLPGAALGYGGCFLAACWLIRYVTPRRATKA